MGLNLGFSGNGFAGTKIASGGAFSQSGNPLGRASNIIGGAYTGNYMQMARGIAGDTQAGKAMSLYGQGQSMANNFGDDDSSGYGNYGAYGQISPDFSKNNFGGQGMSDEFEAMKRRMGGGRY